MYDAKDARHIRLDRRSPSYWRVTFDHPPLKIFGPETMPQLNEVVTALETESGVGRLSGLRWIRLRSYRRSFERR